MNQVFLNESLNRMILWIGVEYYYFPFIISLITLHGRYSKNMLVCYSEVSQLLFPFVNESVFLNESIWWTKQMNNL